MKGFLKGQCLLKYLLYLTIFLSKYQCGLRKGYRTQHCLLTMLEKWKRCSDKRKVFGTLLTDLSKAFDFLDHELLINTHNYNECLQL